MRTLGARVDLQASLEEAARASWAALRAPLAHDAELRVSVLAEPGVLLGAFQRARELPSDIYASCTFRRRGSGGPAARVGEGTVHLVLALPRPSALVQGAPEQIVNRYVRPVLRALGSLGVPARYFGREWISVAHRPAALATFAHEAQSGRSVLEVVVGVHVPFATHARASYLGKAPAALAQLGLDDPVRLAQALPGAFAHAYDLEVRALGEAAPHALETDAALRAEPAWQVTEEEPIGIVAAGRDARGAMRLGGELIMSADALAELEERVAVRPPDAAAVARAVAEVLGRPGVALFGVRSLDGVARVLERAWGLAG
jgi:hypothetical protein